MEKEYILKFSEIDRNHIHLAGGKGANLGEKTKANFPIPNGCVISTYTYKKVLNENNIYYEIQDLLKKLNFQDNIELNKVSKKITRKILKTKISKEIQNEILTEVKRLKAKNLAIRSSATAEDGNSAAWAGQLESFLNINEENIFIYIKKCWASLFSPRALIYRFENNFKQDIFVAVVIQEMIQSEISGTAFTVHPTHKIENKMLIEASFGLGEAVVSGKVTPDEYHIQKKPFQIHRIKINNKKIQLKNINGKNQWIKLKQESNKQTLTNEMIKELSNILIKIENHYKHPCDIEWSYSNNKFYITQSRPITTIKKYHNEYRKSVTRPYSLSKIQILTEGENLGLLNLLELNFNFKPLVIFEENKGSQIYYDFTDENQDPFVAIEYLNDNLNKARIIAKKFIKNCETLENAIENKKKIKTVFNLLRKIQGTNSIGNIIGFMENSSKELIEIFKKTRIKSDKLIMKAEDYIEKKLKKNINKKYHNYIDFLTIEEIIREEINLKELKERKKGYIYFNNQIFNLKEKEKILEKYKITIYEPEIISNNKNQIIGNGIFPGKVKGKINLVFNKKGINQFKEGDILVAPMTSPDYTQAIKKAKAIITDEGGITCHAAIVAREMGKPCIIGTQNATNILNNGDLVEIDANKGIIKKINF